MQDKFLIIHTSELRNIGISTIPRTPDPGKGVVFPGGWRDWESLNA